MFGSEINNPFQYLSPDRIDAKMAVDMFVDVFKDYYQVLNIGHTFIHGARGSGKSMMFRIMKADCQQIIRNESLDKLPFFSIYVPIKDTSLKISELFILDKKHGGEILNEHILCLYFGICIFETLSQINSDVYASCTQEVEQFYNDIITIIKKSGYQNQIKSPDSHDARIYFTELVEICTTLLTDFSINYLSRLIFSSEGLAYKGPICLYLNFLLPIIKMIKKLSFLPNAPLYFLIDDADELNETQAKILNSWVSYRTTHDVCYKISTQLRYPTFHTTRGTKIDSPHDYFEVTLNQIYTSDSKDRYISNVREIVEKRLKLSGITLSADEFFPSNKKQEKAIRKLFEKIREEQIKLHGDSQKAYDYAYRNARPDYMTKELTNKYTYSYAGFEQMAHLSSGIIRHFIDLAGKMYTAAYRKNPNVSSIPVNIQDDEIKKYSQSFYASEFDNLVDDNVVAQNPEGLNNHKKLRNFIEALGQSFNAILKSNSSERRKFAFYFDGQLPDNIMQILKLGEKYGFFHSSTIGSKSGLGRSKLFVLNRMLAPYYDLDPFSFSGYLYLTREMIELGMNNPKLFISKIRNKEYQLDKNEKTIEQLMLFNQEEW